MKPIRIVRIASVRNDRHGGMSRTMYLNGDCLRDLGFEVHYVFADQFSWPFKGGWSRFSQPIESGIRALAAEKQLQSCDLVEVHESLAIGCGAARAVLRRPWKLVAFSYGIERLGFDAMCEYRLSHGVRVPLKSRVVGAVQCEVSRMGLKFCDHIVCSNQKDVEQLVSAGYDRQMLTRHFSGVDEQMLEMGKQGGSHGNGGILFLGTWLDRKGVWDVAPAVTRILRDIPRSFFTAAGCLIEEKEVLAHFPEDVRERVRVIRRLSGHQQLAATYHEHSVFLLPSYFEGQPLVMMEAAAFGLAIVTTPVCGMLDFIQPGRNGLFVPVGDSGAIHQAVSRILNNPEEARMLGAAARQDVERHTWRASAINLAKAYKRLLGRE
jgi:glycosyltransferase involved in cell wall biosynthesis